MPDELPTDSGRDRPTRDQPDIGPQLAELGLTEAELDAALDADETDLDLAAVWEPDDQLVERVTARVEARIADREALQAIVDLTGLGWFTLKAFFSEQN